MENFYLTLPSSTNYPGNTLSHYVTRLRSSLEFTGEWEVALVELSTPTLWNNIDEDHSRFSLKTKINGVNLVYKKVITLTVF